MKTYQELIAAVHVPEFIATAINEHKASEAYRVAADAEQYYAKKNVTMEAFQKVIRDVNGRSHVDCFSANYKLKTSFFRRFVIQQVQYILSNGVTFEKEDTDKKLGIDFDYTIQTAAKKAMVDGVVFLFWNYDHLEVFPFADTPKEPGFAPLYDEETSELKAGIRYWSAISSDTMRATLYEVDGYTDYIKRKGEEWQELNAKRSYKNTTVTTRAGGVESEVGENYGVLPIIPMYANDLRESEIVGIRESIDCYDFIKSGLADDIDDSSSFYWTLKNTGGMDDMDLQKFIERMRVVRAAVLDDDVEAEAHTMEIPVEARAKMLEILKSDLYEDFQIVNVKELSAGNKTATEIRAAYQPMDDKCGDFEYCIRDAIANLFKLIGIEDEPSFKWNRVANQTEETQMILSAANYLDEELILKKLPWLMPEEVAALLERKDAEALGRMIEEPVEE